MDLWCSGWTYGVRGWTRGVVYGSRSVVDGLVVYWIGPLWWMGPWCSGWTYGVVDGPVV